MEGVKLVNLKPNNGAMRTKLCQHHYNQKDKLIYCHFLINCIKWPSYAKVLGDMSPCYLPTPNPTPLQKEKKHKRNQLV